MRPTPAGRYAAAPKPKDRFCDEGSILAPGVSGESRLWQVILTITYS